MGKDFYDQSEQARELFEEANRIMGFRLTDVMFTGTEEDLKQTRVTQPAIFLHSVVLAALAGDFQPDMVAGHSLGEFSALVAAGALTFADGLRLVAQRAEAMQKACEVNPSAMAAVLGLDDAVVEQVCAAIDDVVVAANYNTPGQLVISGTRPGIEIACVKLKEAGAKRALPLQVGGAFHSPLMEPARAELAAAIANTPFRAPVCPIYQNVNALPARDTSAIKANLMAQLTAPVRWTQTVQNMVRDGASTFIECGPGKVLQGLIKKISPEVTTGTVAPALDK
jgi:[acyl-carrier-protein] S-malonyltransferase